jgi:threonine/homoserine/homoserine lactone efflux protein
MAEALRLVLTSLAIMGSPGPATISLVAAGSSCGVRRALPYLLGIVAGTTVVLLAVAGGVTAALLAVPALEHVLVAVAVAYILWLAWHIATARPLAAEGASPDAFTLAGGTLLGVANPKAWLAIGAVFASARLGVAPKLGVLTAMIVAINVVWLVAGRSLAPLLREPGRARVVNVTLAAALVAATALVAIR